MLQSDNKMKNISRNINALRSVVSYAVVRSRWTNTNDLKMNNLTVAKSQINNAIDTLRRNNNA